VYASKQQYKTGDIFLVCDAGGGTSDVNTLKVISSGLGQIELEPLSWVEGRAIGSTLIDYCVEKLILERLKPIRQFLRSDPEVVAYQMLRESSRFESFKCNLGDEAMDLPSLRLPIPGLPYEAEVESLHVENSQMIITQQELRAIFDDQIEKLFNLIDEQLYHLQRTRPTERLTYMILSGGLGSSPYLQKKFASRYQGGAIQFPVTEDLQILRVPKPQLAVCHGLVLDRVQQLKEDRTVYKERYCRNSYGVVVRREYDPETHAGQPVTIDPRDNKLWVEKQIDWFIVQVKIKSMPPTSQGFALTS
jgi:molecular chaperone DnaK (HSP70)